MVRRSSPPFFWPSTLIPSPTFVLTFQPVLSSFWIGLLCRLLLNHPAPRPSKSFHSTLSPVSETLDTPLSTWTTTGTTTVINFTVWHTTRIIVTPISTCHLWCFNTQIISWLGGFHPPFFRPSTCFKFNLELTEFSICNFKCRVFPSAVGVLVPPFTLRRISSLFPAHFRHCSLSITSQHEPIHRVRVMRSLGCVCSHAWLGMTRWDDINTPSFKRDPSSSLPTLQCKGGLKAASVDGFSPKHMHIQTTRTIAKKRRHGFPLLWKRLKSGIMQISVTKQKLRNLKLLVPPEWKKSYKPKLQDSHYWLPHSPWMVPPHPTASIR